MINKLSTEQFISQLYRESSLVSLADFSIWALNLLKRVIHFDAAIWGTGHVSTEQFHTQSTLDVSSDIFIKLKNTLTINPIFQQLLLTEGNAVDMRDVFEDKLFYQSDLYKNCFQPFNIERILSSIHIDNGSGIFTLLTLYRFDRPNGFTEQEKNEQSRLLYHLLSAASHRELLALQENETDDITNKLNSYASAICDNQGIYRCVSPRFIDILTKHLVSQTKQKLPFSLGIEKEVTIDNLHFSIKQHGDLYRVTVRIQNQLDLLSEREKQVVVGICQGGTFKHIARDLALSPSTISNHLYRIYNKLDIHTRSELIAIASNSEL
jgi:DNA-binding CsgD family transcriptional regulator